MLHQFRILKVVLNRQDTDQVCSSNILSKNNILPNIYILSKNNISPNIYIDPVTLIFDLENQ
jgi:hypothetical protein